MKDNIYLGKVKGIIKTKKNYLFDDLWIFKHYWNDSYDNWEFGLIGNDEFNASANVFIDDLWLNSPMEIFEKSIFKENHEFDNFKALLKHAYALKTISVAYRGSTTNKITKCIKNEKTEKIINKDLGKVLNTLWKFLFKLQKRNKL